MFLANLQRAVIRAMFLAPISLGAQQTPDFAAAAESASVARLAWQRASAAFSRNDFDAGRREIERAAAAWPTQVSYVAAAARLAARAHDTTAMLHALSAVAGMGLGVDLVHDTTYAPYRTLPTFSAVAKQHAANLAPLPRSTVKATMSDSTLWPEGLDVDPMTGRVYVGSVRHRTIVELSPNGQERELFPRNLPAMGSVLGVHVDAKRGVVWATTAGIPQMEGYVPADSAIAALLEVSIADGHILRRWSLAASARGHTLGDVTLGPDGTVYLTDSREPVFYRLQPKADSLERFTSPLFRNLQGMAPTPDGRAVYLADYSHGLLHFDLRTHAVVRLTDAVGSTSLGCDGIAWDRGAIVAVQNGVAPARIMRFVLDASGYGITRAEVIDRNSDIADEPTIGTIVGRTFVYVANSQWEKHDDNGARNARVALSRPVVLAVPLPDR